MNAGLMMPCTYGMVLPWLLLMLLQHLCATSQQRSSAAAPDPPDLALAAAIHDVVSFAHLHMHDITSPSVNVTANLSATLNNTFTFTATQTWHRFHAGDETVFIDTGDIHQQWLRDSSNQMRVYIPLAKESKAVADVFVSALKRMSQFFVGDPYASAFNPLPRDQMGDSSLYNQCPKSLECLDCTCEDCAPTCSSYSYQHNFELDSFCFTVDLAHRYWATTKDARAFDGNFHTALTTFVDLLVTEQDHGNLSPYRFRTNWTDQDPPNNHVAPPRPTAKVGLLWSDSRPSDDREQFNFNIPQNMFATVALTKLAELAGTIFDDHELATRATNLSASVNTAIETYGVFKGNLTLPKMYAFEVDGFGNQVLMDDANMPNLLSIPYMVCIPTHPFMEMHSN
jgi:meiotically up-regulated gene 157 (Mug157) protein